jgi:hypothetical protein
LINSYNKCPLKITPLIKKTLTHELFHAYEDHAKKKQLNYPECRTSPRPGAKRRASTHCRAIKKHKLRKNLISDDIIFQTASLLHGRVNDNFKGYRVLDPYELKNKEEFAAINFESFIYDSEYQCRRPSIYNYFAAHFNFHPFKNILCSKTNAIIVESENAKKVTLDLDRIYQFHYLEASKGKGVISGFGHSMLRVVTCAPWRQVGPDCLKDLDHHIVLSYRANTFNLNISLFKGITGKYPAQLFALPFTQIIKEYNVRELRDLYSYPLQLDKQERESFVDRVLESFWEYKGSYKFFSNNCATDTYKLVAGIDLKLDNKLINSRTPIGIFEDLINHGFINKIYTNTKNLGPLNIFKSDSKYFNIAYLQLFKTKLKKEYLLKQVETNPTFLNSITNELEANILRDINIMHPSQLKSKYLKDISALYIIQKRVYNILKEKAHLYSFKLKLIEYEKKTSKNNSEEEKLLASTYGIPSSNEVDSFSNEDIQAWLGDNTVELNSTDRKNIQKKYNLAYERIDTLTRIYKLINMVKMPLQTGESL